VRDTFHAAEENRKYEVNIEPEIFQQQLTQRFHAVAAVFERAAWFPRDSSQAARRNQRAGLRAGQLARGIMQLRMTAIRFNRAVNASCSGLESLIGSE